MNRENFKPRGEGKYSRLSQAVHIRLSYEDLDLLKKAALRESTPTNTFSRAAAVRAARAVLGNEVQPS